MVMSAWSIQNHYLECSLQMSSGDSRILLLHYFLRGSAEFLTYSDMIEQFCKEVVFHGSLRREKVELHFKISSKLNSNLPELEALRHGGSKVAKEFAGELIHTSEVDEKKSISYSQDDCTDNVPSPRKILLLSFLCVSAKSSICT